MSLLLVGKQHLGLLPPGAQTVGDNKDSRSVFGVLTRTLLDTTTSFGSPGPEDVTHTEVIQQRPPREVET